jgi:hypothetical protein
MKLLNKIYETVFFAGKMIFFTNIYISAFFLVLPI